MFQNDLNFIVKNDFYLYEGHFTSKKAQISILNQDLCFRYFSTI